MKITDPSTLYVAIIGGLLLLFFLWTNISRAFNFVRTSLAAPAQWATLIILKYFVYPPIMRGRSRAWLLLQLIYWPGNIVTTFIQTHSLTDIRVRSGYMAIINLFPLLMSDRLYFLADIFGLSIQTFTSIHGTLGMMSTLQAVLHMSVSIHQAGWHLKRNLQLYGLLVSCFNYSFQIVLTFNTKAFSGIALAMIAHLLRRFAIEILSKVHGIAAVLVGITVLCHLIHSRSFPQLGVLVSSVAISLLFLLRWMLLLIRNIKYTKVASRAAIIRMKNTDAARVVIPINRPFRVQPGMIVYIWMPGVSWRSALQTYCFPISWWENDANGNATSITLLARKERGFTRRLIDHPRSEFLTWLDGPYSRPVGLADYSRALFIGTGIGIAPLLSYIRLSVESNVSNHTQCDIFIVWEVDHECKLSPDI
jgi:predicted ferric reductase